MARLRCANFASTGCDRKFKIGAGRCDETTTRMTLQTKQAEISSEGIEERLWSDGLLGDDNPQQLVDTLVFVLGLHLALRGRDEHRRLRFDPPQITVQTGSNGRR